MMKGYSHKLTRAAGVMAVGALIAVTQPASTQEKGFPEIQWKGYSFRTDQPVPTFHEGLTIGAFPEGADGYYFVQFKGPVTGDMKGRVTEAGAELLTYVPKNAFLCRITHGAKGRVESLPDVQWVGIYQPAMRLSQRLVDRLQGNERVSEQLPWKPGLKERDAESAPDDSIELTIQLFSGADVERVQEEVARYGGRVLASKAETRRPRLRVVIAVEAALKLTFIDGVQWIEESVRPTTSRVS